MKEIPRLHGLFVPCKISYIQAFWKELYGTTRLKSSLIRFNGRHNETVNLYGVCIHLHHVHCVIVSLSFFVYLDVIFYKQLRGYFFFRKTEAASHTGLPNRYSHLLVESWLLINFLCLVISFEYMRLITLKSWFRWFSVQGEWPTRR